MYYPSSHERGGYRQDDAWRANTPAMERQSRPPRTFPTGPPRANVRTSYGAQGRPPYRPVGQTRMPLNYHYEEDKHDWVLLGRDLYSHKHGIQRRANIFFALALLFDLALLAWPSTAIPVWGIQNAILTLAFGIHLFKALVLLWALVAETHVYKMYGRRAHSFVWGIWTRRSHVRTNTALSIYGFTYGWVQIPLMVVYIILALTSHPLGLPAVLWWTQWPMGFVSLVLGYISWCFIVSEMAIRKNLEQYVAFGPSERRRLVRCAEEQR